MSVTEVSNQSWFSRLGGAFKGILFGIILFVVAIVLLFWNEGRAVKRHKDLKEGGGAVISVSVAEVVAANEGKLIHTSGLATTEEVLRDQDFAISENALRLRRQVEMFQWRETSSSETKNKVGGGTKTVTTYDYEKTWSASAIDSGGFKQPEGHTNPGGMRHHGKELVTSKASLGAYRLPESEVGRIDAWTDLSVGQSAPSALPDGTEVFNGGYYIGIDPNQPQVGDIRIRFSVVRPTEISVVARQVSDTFEAYTMSSGGTINLQQLGIHSAESMFQVAVQANKTLAWILRALGLFAMFIAFKMMIGPLDVLADVVPLFGRIVGAGTTIISILLAGVISLLTIAIAWIFYRPILAFTLLALAGTCIFLLVKKMATGS